MKVSVAMTTYNGEKYVQEQLSSLFYQTYPIDEVIILDDRSKDKTIHIVETFIRDNQLNHWRFEENKENVGFVKNFINCIKKASGDIIFLCDQDDIWELNKVQSMLDIIGKKKEILALNSAVRLVDKNGEPLSVHEKDGWSNGNIIAKKVEKEELISFPFLHLSKDNISPGCTLCFKKEIKEQLINKEALCVAHHFPHDWAINIIAASLEGAYFINKQLTNYRIHDDNTIGLDLEEKSDFSFAIKGRLNHRIKNAQNLYDIRGFVYEFMKQTDMKQYTEVEREYQFAKKRLFFLNHLNLKYYIALFKYAKIYKKTVGIKGIISDFLYAVKLEGLFQR